jgi:hypothetical protein
LIFYVTPGQENKCDEGISLTIRGYVYNTTTQSLNLSLQNRGTFTIDGYIIRVNNKTKADIGVYTINLTGKILNTSEVYFDYYSRANITATLPQKQITGNLTFIEVQPFIDQNGSVIYCDNIAKHTIVA